jgi:uncharacterized protein YfbU (UPF0304 family)
MAQIKLTDLERIILANQYEILSELKSDSSYEELAENLRDGHEWLYSQYFDYISPVLSESKVEHVLSILGVYGDMRSSFDQLSDKSGIEESQLTFPGFDGNNEAELLSFAGALRKARRFENTLGKHELNSHMPTTETYQRMIEKWRELGSPNYPYGRQAIIEILAARIHPDNRK